MATAFPWEIFTPVAETMTRAATEIILPIYYSRRMQATTKLDLTVVTLADTDSEIFLRQELQRIFPGIELIGEETEGYNWKLSPCLTNNNGVLSPGVGHSIGILDPLDGSLNFIEGPDSKKPFGIMFTKYDNGNFTACWVYNALERAFLFTNGPSSQCFLIGLNDDNTFREPFAVSVSNVPDSRPKEMQFYLFKERSNPDHTQIGGKIFSPLVAPDGKLTLMVCAVEFIYKMLVDKEKNLIGGASPHLFHPWDAAPVLWLLRNGGATVLSGSGQDYRMFNSQGIVVAKDRQTATRMAQACCLAP